MQRAMSGYLGMAALVVVTTFAACSDGALTGAPGADKDINPATASADTITADYGVLEPRLTALDAFAGRRAAVTLEMVRHSVEGVPIIQTLAVREGTATLRIDERADGGGVRTYTLAALQLARYVPSVWQGNVEVSKERLEAADPASARAQAGVYLLVAPGCFSGSCVEAF